jgi:hypothetical protein
VEHRWAFTCTYTLNLPCVIHAHGKCHQPNKTCFRPPVGLPLRQKSHCPCSHLVRPGRFAALFLSLLGNYGQKISALLKILCHHIHLRGAVQGRSKALFGLTSHCIVGQPVVKCGLQSMSLISLECISTWRQLMVHAASYPGIVMRCCLSVLLSRWPPNAQSLVEADGGQRQQLCCALSSDLSVTAKHRIDLGLIGAGRVLQSVNQT